MNHARVFKKTSPNGKLTVYVERRELALEGREIQPLNGVFFVDPNYARDRKVFAQFVLTFRYGREDEEVMGLRFCNEACLCAEQLWPKEKAPQIPQEKMTLLQDTLVRRLGDGAVPFSFSINNLAPPSVTLLPARNYSGAPIGVNYDLRIYVGESIDQRPHKRSTVRMGMKIYQVCASDALALPHASFSKQFLLSEGRVHLEATLDKEIYEREEHITVNVAVTNNSSRSVKKIKVSLVQFVDVAMFSNGKFKNIVASVISAEGCPIAAGGSLSRSYSLKPQKGTIKNWIALEEFYDHDSSLASTVKKLDQGERNVFAIYVSYYVKVKVLSTTISPLGGEASVKVPFTMMRRSLPEDNTNGVKEGIANEADLQQEASASTNGLPVIGSSKSLGDLTLPTDEADKSSPKAKGKISTVTTVIQCHVPTPPTNTTIPQTLNFESSSTNLLINRPGRDFGRQGKLRNSLKVLAGGVCRGLGGQSRPIRNLSRNRDRTTSSESSTDEMKEVNGEKAEESKESKDKGRPKKGCKSHNETDKDDQITTSDVESISKRTQSEENDQSEQKDEPEKVTSDEKS